MLITSLENKRVKKYIKLKEKKYRDYYNEFIIEGEHLVLEAYKRGMIEELILLENEKCNLEFDNIVYLPLEIIKKVSTVESPSKILALCRKIEDKNKLGEKILLLDNIQDPGNLGTIIRSAVAFNIDSVVLSEDCVDLYNSKTIRATQGMIFSVDIFRGNLLEIIKDIKKKNIKVYTTDVDDGIDVRSLSKEEKNKYALVIGNEGNGVRAEVNLLCDKRLYISMNNNVESLNAAVASSILLYEFGR